MIHIRIELDENELRTILKDEIAKKLNSLDIDLVFWDRKELMRRTCMSWDFIQKTFFFDEDFPKYKVGSKWVFPAEKTEAFLLKWLEEQQIIGGMR